MRRRIDFIAIASFLTMALLIVLIVSFEAGNKTEQNTTKQSATVSEVTIENDYIWIYAEELPCPLLIFRDLCEQSDIKIFEELSAGEVIEFRMKTMGYGETLENSKFVNVVSLTIENVSIITLSDYNTTMNANMIPARIAGLTICIILALLIFIVWLRKRKRAA